MVKKSKVNKCLTKKKKGEAPLNPFEVHHTTSKHSVVGVKEKRIAGIPGVSRSRALEKRTKTLGVEYKKRLKKNAFVDERFGAGDGTMSLEDKMVARFTAERQKHHSKHRFSLEEEALTHNGQSIDDITQFEDIYNSDDEDVPATDTTTDLHFGGFLTKNEGQQLQNADHISGKDMMEEIVAKSKLQKLERQKQREEAMGETAELDKDWSEIQGLLAPRIKAIHTTGKSRRDDYDIAVKELMFESKAKPTDRLKTDEELAKERREVLEALEAERLERMRKGTEDIVELSADALLARKAKQKTNKVLISYDEKGKMNKNEEFEKALGDLKKKLKNKESEDVGSEEEEEECEDASSEEEEEEEEDSDEDDDEERGKEEEDLPTITLNNVEGDEGNCVFEDMTEEEEEGATTHDITATTHDILNNNIPFVIEAPEHLSELTSLLEGRNDEVVITIIKRIVASNYPTLKEENKTKTATFYKILVKYLVTRYCDASLAREVLDAACKQLFSLTKHISKAVYTYFFHIINSLKQLISNNISKSLSSVISKRYIIYFYILQKVYPVTDYKHPVITPVLMLINWALSASTIKQLSDVKVGLFLCNYVLQCTKGRYSPELVYFLSQIMKCLTYKHTVKHSHPHEYVSNFKLRYNSLMDHTKPSKLLLIPDLYRNDTSKSDTVFALLITIRTAMRNYHDFTGFNAIFHPLVESLKLLPLNVKHDDVTMTTRDITMTTRDISTVVSNIITLYEQYSMKVMPFLRYANIKPKSIKMYEPMFGDVFVRDRKGKDETKELKKKLKSEMKGAIREIRKDNKFISRVKHREQAGKDRTRKRKVNEIMGFLSKEQGEANDLKYRKKRGEA